MHATKAPDSSRGEGRPRSRRQSLFSGAGPRSRAWHSASKCIPRACAPRGAQGTTGNSTSEPASSSGASIRGDPLGRGRRCGRGTAGDMLPAASRKLRLRGSRGACCPVVVSGEQRVTELVLALPGDVHLPRRRPVGVPPQPASGTGAEEEGEAVGARQCAVPFRCARSGVGPQPKIPQAWQVCLPLC